MPQQLLQQARGAAARTATSADLLCAQLVIWVSGLALLLLEQGPNWASQLVQVLPLWAGLAAAAVQQLARELIAAAAEGLAQLDQAA
jgi:hypothetical protein